MGPLDDIILENILRTNTENIVLQNEDDKIEYKSVFDNSSKEAKAKYAKELAALYNYEGGYLIFGVDDVTKELLGLSTFSQPDNADLSNDINTYFSPAIRFQSKLVKIDNKDIFVIYVNKRDSIPTVCIKSHQQELKEATIYWRYSAQSSPIRAGDLINLLNSLRGEENKKLAEIAEKEYKSKFRPRLQQNGASMGGNDVKIRIENRGPIAHVDGFEIIEKNVDQLFPPTWKNYSITDEGIQIPVTGSILHYRDLEFKLALNYHDDEGHKYQQIIHFNRGKTTLSDPIEL